MLPVISSFTRGHSLFETNRCIGLCLRKCSLDFFLLLLLSRSLCLVYLFLLILDAMNFGNIESTDLVIRAAVDPAHEKNTVELLEKELGTFGSRPEKVNVLYNSDSSENTHIYRLKLGRKHEVKNLMDAVSGIEGIRRTSCLNSDSSLILT